MRAAQVGSTVGPHHRMVLLNRRNLSIGAPEWIESNIEHLNFDQKQHAIARSWNSGSNPSASLTFETENLTTAIGSPRLLVAWLARVGKGDTSAAGEMNERGKPIALEDPV